MAIVQIPTSVKNTIQQMFDDLLEQEIIKSVCRIVYPPYYEDCSACVNDISPGNKGPHIGIHGGPMSGLGICPFCNGTRQIAKEVSETINMICRWDIKTFEVIQNINVTLKHGGSMIETVSFMSDKEKILRCDYMMAKSPWENGTFYKFKRAGDPSDLHKITQGRYVTCLWNRVS